MYQLCDNPFSCAYISDLKFSCFFFMFCYYIDMIFSLHVSNVTHLWYWNESKTSYQKTTISLICIALIQSINKHKRCVALFLPLKWISQIDWWHWWCHHQRQVKPQKCSISGVFGAVDSVVAKSCTWCQLMHTSPSPNSTSAWLMQYFRIYVHSKNYCSICINILFVWFII